MKKREKALNEILSNTIRVYAYYAKDIKAKYYKECVSLWMTYIKKAFPRHPERNFKFLAEELLRGSLFIKKDNTKRLIELKKEYGPFFQAVTTKNSTYVLVLV